MLSHLAKYLFMFRNDLTARSLHKYEGYNICDRCHENIFINKSYGPLEVREKYFVVLRGFNKGEERCLKQKK